MNWKQGNKIIACDTPLGTMFIRPSAGTNVLIQLNAKVLGQYQTEELAKTEAEKYLKQKTRELLNFFGDNFEL